MVDRLLRVVRKRSDDTAEEFSLPLVLGVWESGGSSPLYLAYAGSSYLVRVVTAALLSGARAEVGGGGRSSAASGLRFPSRGDRRAGYQALSDGSAVGSVFVPSSWRRDPGVVGEWLSGVVPVLSGGGSRVVGSAWGRDRDTRVLAAADPVLHYLSRRLRRPFPLSEGFRPRMAQAFFEAGLVQFASSGGTAYSSSHDYTTGRVVWDGVGLSDVVVYAGAREDFEQVILEAVRQKGGVR